METFEKEWRKRFEHFAKSYHDDHLISGWSYHGLCRRLAKFEEILKEHELPPGSRILDLGCGGGTYVRFLNSFGYKVTGLDYSLPSLYRAQASDTEETGHYVGGEAYNLPFYDRGFDLIVSIGVLQALAHPDYALDEMIRILRPGGILVIDFLNAFEMVAFSRSSIEQLTGKPPRVHTYSPFKVTSWLTKRGIKNIIRSGVYLHPRSVPSLGRIFENKRLVNLIEKIPGLSLTCAHSYILAGKKDT